MESSCVRIARPPKGSFFLLGVRGVGKSTWARERKQPKLYWVDPGSSWP